MNIRKILEKHKLWLDTKGLEGERADFSETDFSGLDFSGLDLSGLDLSGLDLSGSDLSGANLSGSDFFGTNLFDTNLYGANLHDAKNIIQFGPIGKERRMGYAVNHGDKIMIQLGCFWGDELSAAKKITEKYGPDSSYLAIVNAVCRELTERRGGE